MLMHIRHSKLPIGLQQIADASTTIGARGGNPTIKTFFLRSVQVLHSGSYHHWGEDVATKVGEWLTYHVAVVSIVNL